jgi:predicted dienelactone hydrolase
MKLAIALIAAIFIGNLSAQTFSVGHTSLSFVDASRNNRSIPTEIYYPANQAGDNVAIGDGPFPLIAFGHGFVMGYDAYENIWTPLVENGYIVAMVNTETSFTPSHENFGKDLAFVIDQMLLENNISSSIFSDAVSANTAVMGHSMGGGASFLAISNSSNIDAIVTLAPAETTPSAIGAAANITLPSLVLAGGNDCVTPIADHQQPMQDALSSNCKTMATINGASHCQFANFNLACNFGELTCGTPATISETEQHDASMNLILPWLNFYLKNQCTAGNTFQSNLTNSTLYSVQQNCNLLCTDIVGVNTTKIEFSPNPAQERVQILGISKKTQVTIYNAIGLEIFQTMFQANDWIDCQKWPSGIYLVVVQEESTQPTSQRIVIAH